MAMEWMGKRYHSLNSFFQEQFGGKVIKIALDGGFTCPNRDGALSREGCIFCGGRGAGDFTADAAFPIREQFLYYRESLRKKWKDARYIAYFQAYTNTYAPVEALAKKYGEALAMPGVVGLSIATRPDCLGDDVVALLAALAEKTYLMVELGFQTAKEETAVKINRCYENSRYDEAVKKLKTIGAHVVTHVILGLPGEDRQDMLDTVDYVVDRESSGIKLHLLYVLKETKLEQLYRRNEYSPLPKAEYVDILVSAIERIPPGLIIHRLTGDAPRDEMIAPLYSLKKFEILNAIDAEFLRRDSWQGKFSAW